MYVIFKNAGLAFGLLLLCPFIYAQQPWKKQPMEMQSRWAKEVEPNNTYQQYPRPQMERADWTNLNGLWDYAITSNQQQTVSHFDGKILVPYPVESALSGVKKSLLPDEALWYKREFDRPQLKQGDQVLLNFGAVDWQATVFINGNNVGEHKGGYTAFSFNITQYLRAGRNEILVKVYDPSDRGIGPHGKQVLKPANIYYTSSSGIWQTVWMETVPGDYIRSLNITPDIDKGIVNIKVDAPQDLNVRVKILAGGTRISLVNGQAGVLLQPHMKNQHLWSPADPFLYNLQVELLKNGRVIDHVNSYFGMRKIAIAKDDKGIDRIFLNNAPYFNLGILDQGFWPDGLYTAPTDEALAFDIKAIKAMGFNTIRKHIKVEPARWYYWADKLGMLVWQDMVNPNQGLPPGAKEEFEKEVKEILDQLHNYPSITTWVLFNERWGQYDQERLTKWVKGYDTSRIINGHSGELLYVNGQLRDTTNTPYINSDLTDVHSYPNPRNALKLPGKAQVLGEFGGIGVPVPMHQWNDLQGWGYIQVTLAELYSKYKEMIRQVKLLEHEGLSGSIYTQPFDVEGEENGLLTYDREIIKMPLDTIRKINSLLNPSIQRNISQSSLFIAKNADTSDTDNRYPELLKAYENGKRDSAFLRRLVLMSIRKKDTLRSPAISKTYIDLRTQLWSRENLTFINAITSSSTAPGFQLFLKDSLRINQILGKGEADKKIKAIIETEEITPYTSKSKQPDWDAIQRKVTAKYGALGEEFVIGRRMLYYWTVSKDWEKMGKFYVQYFERALQRSEYHINNVSWEIFENIHDPSVLAFAAKVMKYDIENFDHADPFALDTYANILYKLGQKDEALKWEDKAVKMSDNDKVLLETYKKMQNGVPTWVDDKK